MRIIDIQGEFKVNNEEYVIINKRELSRLISQSLDAEDLALLSEISADELSLEDALSEEDAMTELFSNRISHFRKKSGLSQSELAKLTGFHQSAIARWESDRVTPTMKNLKILAKALSCSAADLLTD